MNTAAGLSSIIHLSQGGIKVFFGFSFQNEISTLLRNVLQFKAISIKKTLLRTGSKECQLKISQKLILN